MSSGLTALFIFISFKVSLISLSNRSHKIDINSSNKNINITKIIHLITIKKLIKVIFPSLFNLLIFYQNLITITLYIPHTIQILTLLIHPPCNNIHLILSSILYLIFYIFSHELKILHSV